MGNYQGNEYRVLIRLGLPVLVTQLGIIAVSFADTMMVGAFGTKELAAASFVNNLFLVAIVALLGFAGGVMPIVGALFGRGLLREAGSAFRAGFLLNLLMGVAMTAVMGGLYFLLPRFGQPEELMPLIRPYYLIILASVVPNTIFACGQNTANGLTDTAMPMWIMITGNLLNILGNYLLIFGHWGLPCLGLIGAGISTLTARCFMAVAIMGGFALRRRYTEVKGGFLSGRMAGRYRKVWETSYPIMLQNGMECTLWALGAVVCGWFGTTQLASYQIVNTIGQFGFMIYLSAGVALSIRVANHTGAGDTTGIRRATKAGMVIMMVMATLASLLFLFWGHHLLQLFTPDEAVVAAGMPLIVPLILYQYFDATQLNFGNALRGTADVKPLITVSAVSYIIVGIGALFLLGYWLLPGNTGIYYSFGITLACAAAMLIYFYRRAVRKIEQGVTFPQS